MSIYTNVHTMVSIEDDKNKFPGFKAIIRDVGNSYVVTIPMQYIKNDILKPGKKYSFSIYQIPEEAAQ